MEEDIKCIELEIIPIKKIYDDKDTYNKGYKVYSVEVPEEFRHFVNFKSKITISGICLDLNIGKTYILLCNEILDGKYAGSYQIEQIIYEDVLNGDKNYAILSNLGYAESTIENILSAHPNICDLIIENKEIDKSIKIKSFSEKNLNNLIKKIRNQSKELYLILHFPEYNISLTMAKEILNKYNQQIDKFKIALKTDPYKTLCGISGIGFKKADKMILSKNPELINSKIRMFSAIEYIIQENEVSGNTYMNILDCYNRTKELTPECISYFTEILKEKNRFYSDENRKIVSLRSTYEVEEYLAKKLQQGIDIKKDYQFDVSKYSKSIDGNDLTSQQMEILPIVKNNSIAILCGFAGSGKAEKLDAPILTDKGYIPMGEVKVGTKVFGEDGELHNVIGVYPQGVKDIYEVVFSDGTKVECCKEHLWNVQKPSWRDKYKHKWETVDVKTLMQRDLYQISSNGYKRWQYYIPMTKPLKFKERKVLIDPYVLGLLLGDGGLSGKGIYFTNIENDIIQKLKNILEKDNFEIKQKSNIKDYYIVDKELIYKNRLSRCLTTYGLKGHTSYTKFIPEDYLYNTPEIRLKVLQGLIDTDGYTEASGYEFSTTSLQLCEDVKFLVQSLGGTATYSIKDNAKYTHNDEKKDGAIAYRLYIKAPNGIVFHTSEKHNKKYKVGQTQARRTIREINYVGKSECQCIKVDNPTELYLTNDCIVTHNTTSVNAVIQMLKDAGKTFLLLAPTGRASKVLSQNTGENSSTIHRILLRHQKLDNIDVDFIVCDEATMIDIFLMKDLLKKVNFNNTSILFVCDPAQLSSVGCGNVLSDMINSNKFPTVFLDKIFRYNEGGISYVATETRNGSNYFKSEIKKDNISKFGAKNDYAFIEVVDNLVKEEVLKIYKKLIKKGNLNINEIVVLSAYNSGKYGTIELNNSIQNLVNPQTPENETQFSKKIKENQINFRIGDKVIQIKNDYDVTVKPEKEAQDIENSKIISVFNGEDGIIVDANEEFLTIKFNDVETIYNKQKISNIMLGYAITIHKSQGSTFDNVIVISPSAHTFFSTRNLLYVALTRAKNGVIHIGSKNTIGSALKRNESKIRKTFLIDLLQENLDRSELNE